MHGKGRMEYANGDNYKGDWFEDKWNGEGLYIFANGERYKMICSNNTCYYAVRCRNVGCTLTM